MLFKKRKRVGLFVIHGFLSNPDSSFGNLKTIFKKNRIRNVMFPSVQAHGEGEDINLFDYEKATAMIEKEYLYFKSQYDETYLIGFSMGGVIAGYLASKIGADKLLLVAPAFKYEGRKQVLSKIGSFLKRSKKDDTVKDVIDMSLKDEEAKEMLEDFIESGKETDQNGGINYVDEYQKKLGKIKVSVFMNFTKLVSSLRSQIKELNTPTRVLISEDDDLVPLDSAFFIFNKVKDEDKKLTVYSGVKHRIFRSRLRREVLEEMLKFLYGKKKVKYVEDK